MIPVPVMGAEYNYEVSGGKIRNNQSGIARMGVIGCIVQHAGQGGEPCRVVKTRRACKIFCSDGVVRTCNRG